MMGAKVLKFKRPSTRIPMPPPTKPMRQDRKSAKVNVRVRIKEEIDDAQ